MQMVVPQFHTLEDIRAYVRGLAGRHFRDDPRYRVVQLTNQGAWFFLLGMAYFQYYFFDVMVQLFTMPSLVINVTRFTAHVGMMAAVTPFA
jgi:hypothetical protein